MVKVSNRNTRAICEICSKLTITTSERCQLRCFGVFIANFEQISFCSGVSMVDFDHLNTDCVSDYFCHIKLA